MHATNKRHAIEAGEVRRLYQDEGWAMARLAAHYGCGASTIRRRLAELGVAARPPGPATQPSVVGHDGQVAWSPAAAYAIGVIATDGNLSNDGRHLSVTSKDGELLEALRACLNLTNSITTTRSGSGQPYYRLQWGNKRLIHSLHAIGLTPAKSLTLGALAIPDEFFGDFFRGCIDGDGSILVYTDRYHTRAKAKYVYERLAVCLVSASPAFIEWVQAAARRLYGVAGALIRQPQRAGRAPQWLLKYGKREALVLLRAMYDAPDVPCLARKRDKALPFLGESGQP
jgi:hypothetical protein